MSRDHSGLDPVVTMIDQHAFLHGFGATAAPTRSFEDDRFAVNSLLLAGVKRKQAATPDTNTRSSRAQRKLLRSRKIQTDALERGRQLGHGRSPAVGNRVIF
jgi:hypothetical protein